MLVKKFEDQVEKTPDNIAVKTVTERYTYRELNRYAGRIARQIPEVAAGGTVALLFEHGVHMIANILGALKAGKAYVPMSVDYPANRLSYMLSDSESSLLITNKSYASFARDLARPMGIPVLEVQPAAPGETGEEDDIPGQEIPGESIAYILYTSGSTGRPKGVVQTHRNADYYNMNWVRVFSITASDRMTLFSSFCHDGSVQDMYSALHSGATLYPLNMKNRESTVDLSEFLNREAITIWHSVPSLFAYFANTLEGSDSFPALRYILLGGEPVRQHEVELFRNYFPHSTLANVYGQTESSVNSICLISSDQRYKKPIIGAPLSETEIFVVDDEGSPVDTLEAGEIVVACRHISPGYWKNPEAAERVFGEDETLGRLYWTGDLGCLLADGNIEFLGRKDHQVKIRGFRVEPGEIETQLLKHEQIKEAVVMAREDKSGDRYLSAYVVPVDGKEVDVLQLRNLLSGELPDYMVPASFVLLDKMPLTPNGKIDRKSLPEAGPTAVEPGEDYTAPRDEVERELAVIWAEVLGIDKEKIGIDADFFRIGGHSLKATIVTSKMHKVFNVRVPLAKIFKTPSIRELARYVKGAKQVQYHALKAVEKREYYPQSSAQKRLFFLDRFENIGTGYNISMAVKIRGQVERESFENTFKRLISRHESLRTSFHMIAGEPVQKVHDEANCILQITNKKEPVMDFIRDFIRSFDLSQAPLMRAGLLELVEGEHLLMIDMHHIISDGTSMGILIDDFTGIYTGESLLPLHIQYKDFGLWQQQMVEKGQIEEQENYWLSIYPSGVEIPRLDLPVDFARPEVFSFSGARYTFKLEPGAAASLKELGVRTGATLYMTLLAAFNILLYKYTSREDIVVGSGVMGRSHTDLHGIVGMFVNSLPLRSFPRGRKTCLEFIEEVKENSIRAFENQDVQFEDLVEKINPLRDPSRNPIFDVSFMVQNFEVAGKEMKTLTVSPYPLENKTAKFDLTLLTFVDEGEREIQFVMEYCTALFKEETIRRMALHFLAAIGQMVEEPGLKIHDLEMISEKEKRQLLFDFNETAVDYPADKTIHELFEEQVERNPDNTAVVEADLRVRPRCLTYRELNKKSGQLAAVLQEKGVRPDTVVGLMVERSLEMIVGILGILKAGGAYLPIDPGYPGDRIDYMLADSGAKVLLSKEIDMVHASVGNRLACSADMVSSTSTLTSTCQVSPANLAYIIYTSGTTGQPKGTLIEHKNVVRLLFNDKFTDLFTFSRDDTWTLFHSYCFDFSVWEMYGALLYGGRLIVVSRMAARDTDRFLDIVESEKVTVLNQTPSAFYNLAARSLADGERRLYLRYIVFGGEALNPLRLREWGEKHPGTKLINMYGITETTVHVTYKEITDKEMRWNISNIGKPVPTLSAYVMDRGLRLLPGGVPGELCVGGEGVARGYLNRPGLTGKKFVKNPYIPGEILYRSGDLVKLLAKGDLEYLGRIDQQVKIRGYRVELGEIESCLLQYRDIGAAVVVAREEKGDKYGDRQICAYIVPRSGTLSPDTAEIRDSLSRRLPDYMIPAYFIEMERIPLTANGKVDRGALPAPEIAAGEDYSAPRDEVESELAAIWSEVLAVEKDKIGIDADFFRLGGHSLKATIVTSKMHKVFNVRVPLAKIFITPTIRKLAGYVKAARKEQYKSIEPAEKKEYYPLTPMQQRFYMIQGLNPHSTAFNMPQLIHLAEKEVDKEKLEQVFNRLIERHESLRTSFVISEDQPVQKIHASVRLRIDEYEYEYNGSDEALWAIRRDFIRPFDLSQVPLLRMGLVRGAGSEDRIILLVDMHHIISDGTSHQVLGRDFMSLYTGDELPSLKLRYRDFSQWLSRILRAEAMKEHEQYWFDRMKGELPVLDLPTDYPRPGTRSLEGARYTVTLGTGLTGEVNRLIKQTGTTLYMVLLTAFNTLLYRYTGQQDILVGTPTAGRYHADLANIIGLVIGGILMRNFPKPNKTFTEFLEEVKENTLEAFEHQAYPLEELLKKINWQEKPGHNHISDVALVVQNMDMYDGASLAQPAGKQVIGSHIPAASKLDVTIYVMEQAGDISLIFEYSTVLFKSASIERMAGHLISLLQEAVKDPEKTLSAVDMVTDKEKMRLLGRVPSFYPLTHAQKRIYYTEKIFPGTSCNNGPYTVRYNEILDRQLLEQAINVVLRKNDGLRLRIVEFGYLHEPLQYIAPHTHYTLEAVDVGEERNDREQRLKQWAEKETSKPLPMIDSPLYYFIYLKFNERESGFYLKLHHIITDAWSIILMLEEITSVYRALKAGEAVDESINPSYVGYIFDEEEYLRSVVAERNREFWTGYLLPLPEKARLTKHVKEAPLKNPTVHGKVLAFPSDLRTKIHRYREIHKTSLFKLILSALSIYISRVTGSDDTVIATTNYNRTTDLQWKISGMFVSTFPIRVKAAESMRFRDFVEKNTNEVNYILKNHQRYPFNLLLDELRQVTGVDPVYLLDINLIGHADNKEARYGAERVLAAHDPSPLTIHINHSNKDIQGVLELQWHYQPHLFSGEDIEQIHRCITAILDNALTQPDKFLREIELLSEEDKKIILYDFNAAAVGYPPDKTVDQLFAGQVEKTPDNIAVVGSKLQTANYNIVSLTYNELNKGSDQLAHLLREKGVGTDTIVALMLERSIDMIAAILGTLKAGAAYLPIDPEYPEERIKYMLADSGAKVLLSKEIGMVDASVGNRLACSADMISSTLSEVGPANLAYIIYTSGSTGRPKGVLVEHGNLTAYLEAFEKEFNLGEEDIVIQQASFTFDAFVEEIYPILLKGGKLAVPRRDEVRDIELLADYIRRHHITMITCSPLMLNELNRRGLEKTIRIFISGGDQLNAGYVDHLVQSEPGKVVVYNTYGPTESTVCASYYRCQPENPDNVPIGKPIADYSLYILDKYNHLLPVGVPGELCISGAGVSRGYLNNPELTAEKFNHDLWDYQDYHDEKQRDPQKSVPPAHRRQKMYKTGDLACWLPDGNIEFMGRVDHQVKIRGYRIEPGEIETKLLNHEHIKEAVVLARESKQGDKFLCAYVVSSIPGFDTGQLNGYLSRELPDYMIPSYFVQLERIPLTAGGKADRRALPAPEIKAGEDYTAPRDEIERRLVDIWSEVLAVEKEKIGIDTNFFRMGGHSLKAAVVTSKIHKVFNVRVPLALVFQTPFIRELACYVKEAKQVRYHHVKAVEKREYYPQSSAQKRLFFLDRFGNAGTGYNISMAVKIRGQIDKDGFENTFKQLIHRHESLRTSFHMIAGEPVQVVHGDANYNFQVTNEEEPAADFIRDFVRCFDLSQAPLMRAGLLELTAEEHLLLFDMHHIVSDGSSMGILMDDFTGLYLGEKLTPLNIQYKDFTLWQRRMVEDGKIEEQENFWLSIYPSGVEIPRLDLPADFPRPEVFSFAGARYTFELEPGTAAILKEMGTRTGATLYMILLAAFNILLYKYTSQEDMVLGSVVMDRPHADLLPIIGMFVNTLPMRNCPTGRKTCLEFIKEVKENSIRAFENKDVQFEDLVEKIKPPRNLSRNPIFDVSFVVQNFERSGRQMESMVVSPVPLENKTSKFDLTLFAFVDDREGKIGFVMEYCTALFKEETIRRMAFHLLAVIRQTAANPEFRIDELGLLTEEEKQQLLADFNDTAAEYPSNKTIQELFAEQVERTPDHIAVVGAKLQTANYKTVSLTYKELNKSSDQLAHFLQEKGVQTDTIVAIMLERSIDMIAAILGTLKAGAAYLPVDPDYPQERVEYILADSGAKVLLKKSESPRLGHPIVSNFEFRASSLNSSGLSYIMYTSGSTGWPRGVVVNHRNVVRLVKNCNYIRLTGETRILQTGAPVFDATTFEIWGSLLNGGQLVLTGKEVILDALLLSRVLKNHCVNTLWLTAPLFNRLTDENIDLFSPLSDLLVGGDVLSPPYINRVRDKYPGLRIINGYGPTENTTFSTTFLIDKEYKGNIPIGKPIANSTAYIVDKAGGLQPVGVSGELWVGGDGVACGYLNNPELTADRFLTAKTREVTRRANISSVSSNDVAKKMYKTGDLARWLPDGNIEFLGRMDFQVKVRGFRIEPGEIEKQILQSRLVKEAVVTVIEEDKNMNLCAYIVPLSTGAAIGPALRKDLLTRIPGYMMPAYFVEMDRFPLTPNGKIDRKALPEPGKEVLADAYRAPRNRMEEKLAAAWAGVLNIEKEQISIDGNFFELGGHSLNATLLVSRIHKELGVKVPLAEIFRLQTLRAVSEYITHTQKDKYTYTGIEPVEKREYYALSSAQKRMYFLQRMDRSSTAYNIPRVLPLGKKVEKERLESTLKRLIARHESLRTSFIMVDEVPVQRIHNDVEFHVEVKVEVEEELSYHSAGFVRPFDLEQAPLFRSGLLKLQDGHHIWIVDMHHIVSDGTSVTVLTEDFISLYNDKELEPLRLQYKDFSSWQNRLFASGEIKAREDYWLDLYSDEIPVLDIPADYKRPEVFTFAGSTYPFMLERELAIKLRELGTGSGGTLYMNILAILNTLFYKYTGQRDIIIGSGIAGRPHADLQHIIGMFVNSLAMRNYPRGEKTFEFFLKEVIAGSVEAFENQDVQFEELVDKLQLERDPSRNPLFDISMVVQNFRRVREGYLDIDIETDAGVNTGEIYKNTTSKFDMTFFLREDGDDVHFLIEYYTGIFERGTIARMISHFKNILRAVVDDPSVRLKDIEMISEEEKSEVLREFNGTVKDYPADTAVHELFAAQVEKAPDRIVLIDNGHAVTYRELDAEAGRLASYLHYKKGVKPGDPVGILMSQSLYRPAAILGVLKAGGGYMPIDPSLPGERMKYMIKDTGTGTILSEKKYIHILNRLQWECEGFHSYLCMDSFDVRGEEEVDRNELMNEELWHHVGETAVDDITGGGWISSYTGEPLSKEEMDEYGDNVLKKLEPLLHKHMRVLEIGAASGITMYRVAPKVDSYYGTDLSQVIIRKNKQKVDGEGYGNIKLSCLPAHEIDKIEENNFHLIIINSVIQCFHGYNYLGKVIKKALDLLGEKGYLFIGDIMDQDKKEALIRELAAFKKDDRDKLYTTKTDFSSELFVARGFWRDLAEQYPEIEDVEFSDKIYTIENELTKFRYDTLITVNKQPSSNKSKKKGWKREKYQDDLNALPGVGWEALRLEVPTTSPAYIIYTSGTAGKPKGVMTKHRSLVNLCSWHNRNFEVTAADQATLYAGFGFDASVWELFPYIIKGASLHIIDDSIRLDIGKMIDYYERHCITISFLPTQFCEHFMEEGKRVPWLRVLLTGGDKLHTAAPGEHAAGRQYDLYNNYGPTENAVVTTAYRVERPMDNIPIGKPIDNTGVYILSGEGFTLQPKGVPGELCICGDGLALGYLNNPELTNEKFNHDLQDYQDYHDEKQRKPQKSDKKFLRGGQRIYKTGDLARWLPDGNIEFRGRMDQQVKIRGFRIELGEIESRLLTHQWIKEAVVINREDERGDRYLCAYICTGAVPGVDSSELESELKEYLSRSLPGYMVPSYFVPLAGIPLTPNGKVDRKKLPRPGFASGKGSVYKAPASKIEKKLAELWAEVLGMGNEKIGINDDFFRIGGHSLKATVLTAKIHKVFDIKVPLLELFKTPTIEQLARYIELAEKDRYLSIKEGEKREYYPVSSAQKRLYVLHQLEGGNMAYNMPGAVILEGDLDQGKLEKVLIEFMNRHETLRTSFHMVGEEPVQKVHEKDCRLQISNRQNTSDKAQITNIINAFIGPFDLSKAPLMRLGLMALSRDEHVFMMDLHHIVSDGVSQGLFFKEMMSLYQGDKLPGLRLQYKDYALWQQSEEEKERVAEQFDYWSKEFNGEIPVLNLPADFARPTVQSFEGKRVNTRLDAGVTGGIKQMAFAGDSTLFMVLLSFYTLLLSRLSGQEDIVVGTPAAGRDHADLQPIIGMFVNTLALRNRPRGEQEFIDFLREVKERTLAAFENQEYLFEDLVEKVEVKRDTGRNPLFDVMFSLLNMDSPEIHIPGLKLKPYPLELNISKFDMMLYCSEGSEGLVLTFEYCTRLFKEETVERFAGYFKTLVSAVLDNPQQKIKDIEMISPEERKQILYDFNDTRADYPRDKTIHRLFAEQVERTPDNIACVGAKLQNTNSKLQTTNYKTVSLTYKELDKGSDQLAHLLQEKGVRPDTIVAIMMERSIEMMIGIFAILKAGAAYLPIDPEYPEERIKYMLADSGTEVLVNGVGNRLACSADMVSSTSTLTSTCRVSPANLAYIIYTSGSTGKPKGVMVEHHSVINRLHWMQRSYPLDEQDRILQKTPVVFDVSVWELFWWSFQGASLCLLGPGEEKSPEAIVKAVQKHGITTLHFVPSMLTVFLDYIEMEENPDTGSLRSARRVFASGEALGTHQVRLFNRLLYGTNKTRLINLYGPTEATVDVSFFNCDLGEEQIPKSIPIGKPIDNTRLVILDRYLKLQPVQIAGELYIAGAGLARGYLNRPELTNEKFYMSHMSSMSYLFYRTGDLARWLPDGNIEYLGRMDFQVKIRGFRIELGEIEDRLLKNPEIKEAVVIAGTDRQGDQYLCAYIVLSSPAAFDSSKITELRDFLAGNLPDYMIPSYFVPLESIPLTANGKINRKSLPEPRVLTGEDHVAPRTAAEEKLAEIWADLLDIPRENIGIDDGFFKLGGHSLKATILIARIHKAFQVKLTLADIFNRTTIRRLAQDITGKSKEKHYSVEPAPDKPYYDVSSAQKRLYVIQQMDPANIYYNMNWVFILEGGLEAGKLEQAFNRVIERHEVLRTGIEMRGIHLVQVIRPEAYLEIEYMAADNEFGEDEMPGSQEMIRMAREFVRPFDLSKPPPMRVRLIKIKEKAHILILDLHHIATDAVSNKVIIGEVINAYAGWELPPVKLQYKDFSQWQNNLIAGGGMRSQEEYWLRQFAGDIPRLNLPLDFPRPAVHDGRCGGVDFEINPELTSKIKELTLETGTTFYMVLLAVYNILLSRYSGQEDIIVGSAVGGRRHADLENVVGMFINMLAVRSRPLETMTFSEFLNQVKTDTLDAYENQDYPFNELVGKLGIEVRPGRNPLFDVEFNFHNLPDKVKKEKPEKPPELTFKLFTYGQETLSFDLGLIAYQEPDSLRLVLGYLTALFKKSTVENMAGHFLEILEKCLQDKETKIEDIVVYDLVAGTTELTKEDVTGFEF